MDFARTLIWVDEPAVGYQLNIPLTEDGHIDAAARRKNRAGWTVRRLRRDEDVW